MNEEVDINSKTRFCVSFYENIIILYNLNKPVGI